jgi:hypothetical protein
VLCRWRAVEDGLADTETALAYRRRTEKELAQGLPAERKQLVRTGAADMRLAPERLEVEVS